MAEKKEEERVNVWSELPSFKVKIPDVEIEFHSPDVKEVHSRFDEIMTYLKQLMNDKNMNDKTKRR